MDKKAKYLKIGNSSFHVETVRSMKLKGFKDTYSKVKAFDGVDLEKLYSKITGSSGNVG